MNNHIDPREIKTIKANTPITITCSDGRKFTAYSFIFEELEEDDVQQVVSEVD